MNVNEALRVAKQYKHNINYCMEYEDAFVFSTSGSSDIGGNTIPIVVLKSNGNVINMVEYCDIPSAKLIGEYSV